MYETLDVGFDSTLPTIPPYSKGVLTSSSGRFSLEYSVKSFSESVTGVWIYLTNPLCCSASFSVANPFSEISTRGSGTLKAI